MIGGNVVEEDDVFLLKINQKERSKRKRIQDQGSDEGEVL